MKRIFLTAALVLAASGALFAQGSAYTNVAALQTGGNIMRVIPSAPVVVCSYPGTGGTPCTNLATTYTSTSLSVACSSTTQVVAPSTGTCSGTADFAGNFGFFAPVGTYVYYFEASTGWQGPYTVVLAPGLALAGNGTFLPTTSLSSGGATGDCVNWQAGGALGDTGSPCGGGGGGSPASPNGAVQFNNVGSFGSTRTTWLPNALTFSSSTGKVTLDNFNGIPIVTTDYNWSQSPAGTVSIGANTVTLTPSPAGIQVIGATWQPHTSIHLGAVGTPEDVLVTATTCALIGGPGSCTITFTAANAHGAGFTVGSSSAGIQEAINAGNFTQTNYTRSGDSLVIIPPGEYNVTGTIAMPSFAPQYLQGYGAVLTCSLSAHCLQVGDISNATLSGQKVVEGLTFRPGVVNGAFSAIYDNSQHTTVTHIQTAIIRTANASFAHIYLAGDDESASVDHIDTTQNYSWAHCSTDFCSSAIATLPGLATVLSVDKSNLSMQCQANGIDYQSGNTLSVTNTIIQGYAQFGVRTNSSFSNLPGGFFSHDYWEAGSGCVNPMYGTGASAGLIVEGGYVTIEASNGPTGKSPNFASTGGTIYNYYVVPHSTGPVVGAPMLAGTALTNGAGNITVTWPQLGTAGVITYDVLRTSGNLLTTPFPYTANCGGGTPTTCGSVTTALAAAAACLTTIDSIVMCSFVDNAAANTTAYTVAVPTYSPGVTYWPASIAYVAVADSGGTSPSPASGIFIDKAGSNMASNTAPPVSVPVTNVGIWLPRLFAQACDTVPGIFMTCLDAEWKADAGGSTLLWNGLYNTSAVIGRKGRLNFEEGIYNGGVVTGGEIITLADSNPAKTLSTTGYTPAQDAADTYIGLDNTGSVVATSAQLAIGAPVSQSRYINSTPDNTSWLERLTSSLETFKVNITTNQQYQSTLVTGTPPLVVASTTPVLNFTAANHPTFQDCGATTTCANTQKTATFVVVGRVSFPTATTVTVTALPFTSSTSYTCTAQDVTTAAGVVNATTYTSGSSVTFTEIGGVNTDAMRYQCSGF